MTIGEKTSGHDTSTDIRRLIDAGYTVTFSRFPLTGPGSDCYAEITSDMGSRWKCFGATPGEAIRENWPLGDGPGRGGCAHCGGLGCEVGRCPVCAAYTDEPGNGVCGVCGRGCPIADKDELPGDEDDEPDEYEDMIGPEPPCRASSQFGTVCAERGVHWRHDDGCGTVWESM